jgi:hypothetical protein
MLPNLEGEKDLREHAGDGEAPVRQGLHARDVRVLGVVFKTVLAEICGFV